MRFPLSLHGTYSATCSYLVSSYQTLSFLLADKTQTEKWIQAVLSKQMVWSLSERYLGKWCQPSSIKSCGKIHPDCLRVGPSQVPKQSRCLEETISLVWDMSRDIYISFWPFQEVIQLMSSCRKKTSEFFKPTAVFPALKKWGEGESKCNATWI